MANYNVAPIGIEIQTNIKGAIDAFVRLQGELKKTDTQTKSSTYALQKLSGTMGSMGRILTTSLGFGSLQQGLQTLTNAFKAGYKESSNFIENYNLFNVSFRSNTEEALKFQYELNRAFKTNMSETLRMQGRFQNLATSLGITNKESSMLSENLTKLTYDISSLFNIGVDTASSKLFSGIVGQTKPLRELGIDVTMQTLQTDLDRLGIKAQVTQLTQAEKVLLRYIAILRQSTNAQGDMARTIETPQNAFRLLNAQIQETTRWFGTLFLGTITKILPYIQAFVIVLKEIFEAMSTLMGFKLEDYNFLGKQEDDGLDLQKQLEDDYKASEKLKKSLMGFDEINNLSSSTSGGEILGKGSYYDQLAKWIKDYENGMSKVKIKAEEIRDTIYEWLGIFRDVDGKLKIVDDGIADMAITAAQFTWTEIKSFFYNMGLFVKDVAKWFKDNPDWYKPIISFLSNPYVLGAGAALLAISNPLGAIKIAALWFVGNYGEIKKWWEALTPSEQLLKSLGLLAIAIAAVVIAASGGTASPFIMAGWVGIGALALLGINAAIQNEKDKSGSTAYVPDFTPTKPNPNALPDLGYKESLDGSLPPPRALTETAYERKMRLIMEGGYADGGFPSAGQMFVARENGAEMVGSLGGRTAVANNGQIVEGIKQGVYEAMMSANGSGQPITVVMQYDDIAFGRASISAINKATVSTGQTLLIG